MNATSTVSRRARRWGWLACGAVAALAACGDKEPPRDHEAEFAKEQAERQQKALANVTGPTRVGPAAAVLPPAATPSAEPGPAYFFVEDVGIAILEDGVFRSIPLADDRFVHSIGVSPNGTIWAGTTVVYRIEDGAWVPVGDRKTFKPKDFENRGFIEHLHVTDDGKAWAASNYWFFHWDGNQWTAESAEQIGIGTIDVDGKALPVSIEEMLVDDTGRVFLRSNHRVHVKQDGKWSIVYDGLGGDEDVYIKAMLPTAKGLVMPWNFGVMRLSGGQLAATNDRYAKPALNDHVFLDGDTVVAAGWKSIMRVPVEGGDDVVRTFDELGTPVGFVSTADMDGQGRLWLGTENGVVIVSRDNRPTQWLPGTVPELPAQVKVIHVVGGGPTLPSVGPVAKGTIRGRLAMDGKPVVGATVEACASPRWMLSGGDTPCKGAPYMQTVNTDESGAFVFADVPLNNYGIAAQYGGTWFKTGSATCAGMQAGDTCDIGALILRKPAD